MSLPERPSHLSASKRELALASIRRGEVPRPIDASKIAGAIQ
jgi:hypothetical protein